MVKMESLLNKFELTGLNVSRTWKSLLIGIALKIIILHILLALNIITVYHYIIYKILKIIISKYDIDGYKIKY